MKFIKEVKPLDCKMEDWVTVDGSKLQISHKAKTRFGQIICSFRGKFYMYKNCLYKFYSEKTIFLSKSEEFFTKFIFKTIFYIYVWKLKLLMNRFLKKIITYVLLYSNKWFLKLKF